MFWVECIYPILPILPCVKIYLLEPEKQQGWAENTIILWIEIEHNMDLENTSTAMRNQVPFPRPMTCFPLGFGIEFTKISTMLTHLKISIAKFRKQTSNHYCWQVVNPKADRWHYKMHIFLFGSSWGFWLMTCGNLTLSGIIRRQTDTHRSRTPAKGIRSASTSLCSPLWYRPIRLQINSLTRPLPSDLFIARIVSWVNTHIAYVLSVCKDM